MSRKGFDPSLGLNVADLLVFDLSCEVKNTQILVAGGGLRQELFDPSQFLANKLLNDLDARRKLTLWISVARSDYILKKVAFRKPKIWMLTGRYLLHNVRKYSLKKLKPEFEVGVSPQITGGTGGPPIGGSLGLDWEHGIEADMRMPDANVWAAQWRLLDVEYVLKSTIQAVGPTNPVQFGLFPDVTSQGVLRGGSREAAKAWSVRVGLLLNEVDSGIDPEKYSDETYDQWFKEALGWFETEIDDESDDEPE